MGLHVRIGCIPEDLYLDINDKLKAYLKDEFKSFDADAFSLHDFYSQLTNPISAHFNRITVNEIKNFYLSHSGDEHYNVINFNYTSTIEKLARYNGKRIPIGLGFSSRQAYFDSVYHIHQRLQDDEILVGVNDVSQIANKKFHNNRLLSNMYVKPNTNELLGSGVNQDCEEIISSTNLFVVFGTSAGITDQRWWDLVCKRIIGSNTRLIYFVHKTQKRHHQNLYIEEMKREEISKLIEHAGMDSSEILENVIDKCYVSFSDSMFKLPVTYNDRIKTEKIYKVDNTEVTMRVLEMGMKYVVVEVRATDELKGVSAENMWLKEFFPNFTRQSQYLLTPQIEGHGVPFDKIPIQNGECRKDIYFEISSFYGKTDKKSIQKLQQTEHKLKAAHELL